MYYYAILSKKIRALIEPVFCLSFLRMKLYYYNEFGFSLDQTTNCSKALKAHNLINFQILKIGQKDKQKILQLFVFRKQRDVGSIF